MVGFVLSISSSSHGVRLLSPSRHVNEYDIVFMCCANCLLLLEKLKDRELAQ